MFVSIYQMHYADSLISIFFYLKGSNPCLVNSIQVQCTKRVNFRHRSSRGSRAQIQALNIKVLDMNIIILVTHPSVSPPVSPDAVIPEVKTDLRSEGGMLR